MTNSITQKLRNDISEILTNKELVVKPAFTRIYTKKRRTPSIPPEMRVIMAADPEARFHKIPIINTAAIGGLI